MLVLVYTTISDVMCCFAVGSRRLRSTLSMDEDAAKAFLSYDSKKQKPSLLLTAAGWLNDQQTAWSDCCPNPSTVSSILNGQPPQPEDNDSKLLEADPSRAGAALLLHAAAASRLPELRSQHELEGKLLTNSMMLGTADKRWGHQQLPDVQPAEASTSGQVASAQPASFARALAGLWAPFQANAHNDEGYCSRKWTKEELTCPEVRSPKRYVSLS